MLLQEEYLDLEFSKRLIKKGFKDNFYFYHFWVCGLGGWGIIDMQDTVTFERMGQNEGEIIVKYRDSKKIVKGYPAFGLCDFIVKLKYLPINCDYKDFQLKALEYILDIKYVTEKKEFCVKMDEFYDFLINNIDEIYFN